MRALIRRWRIHAAVLALVAVLTVASVASGGDDPRLSQAFRDAAAAPCATFEETVAPARVGAGREAFLEQAGTFVAARGRLARELEALAGDGGDRRRLAPLLRLMDEGTRALTAARRAARDHDRRADEAAMRRFENISTRQERRSERLGLGTCGL